MSNQNIELSKQIYTVCFSVIWPKFESKLFFFPFRVFFIGETLLLLDIKAKYPFAPSPTRRPCCGQNDNTIFFTSEKYRIANPNAYTIIFH